MRRTLGVLAVVLAAIGAASVLQGQAPTPPPPGRGAILGRVIDGTTEQPIAGAFVSTGGQPRLAADAQGRFVFRDLRAGTYALSAAARGYLGVDARDAATRPNPVTVELADAEQVTNVVVRLFKPSRISGTVIDDLGDPVEGLTISILRVDYIAGHRRLIRGAGASSNDRGDFRSGPLAPGSYVVHAPMRRTTVPVALRTFMDRLVGAPAPEREAAFRSITGSGVLIITEDGYRSGDLILQPPYGGPGTGTAPGTDGRMPVAAPVFYPGVSNANQATPITLASAEERGGVNLQLRLVPAVRVSGRLMGPDGPLPHHGVSLLPDGTDLLSSDSPHETGLTVTNADGVFTFLGVAPGSYVAKAFWLPPVAQGSSSATPPPIDGTTLSGSVSIFVGDGDLNDVLLTLRRGPVMRGRLVFDGTSAPPAPAQIARGTIGFELADGRGSQSPPMPPFRAKIETDGQFTTVGLPIGRYLVRVDGYPRWTLESAMWNGRDISEQSFETSGADDLNGVVITLTDTPAALTGIVRSSSGTPAPNATVLLISRNVADWVDRGSTPRRQLRTASTSAGAFRFAGMPAGEYLAVAITGPVPDRWRMPEFMDTLARAATRVTIERRATQSLDLTVVSLAASLR